MLQVNESVAVPADVETAWQLVGPPEALADWHPAVDSSDMTDDRRHVVLGDGARVEERITDRSDRSYSYEFIESPLPVSDYSATVSAEATDEGTTITWKGTFEAAGVSDSEAEQVIAGIYRAGLDSAAERLG